MENKEYKERIIDKKIKEYLEIFGAVCIEGPKYVGKTWTGSHLSNSKIDLSLSENNFHNKNLALINNDLVLDGENPRLIDEWQEVPSIWDAVRSRVDRENKRGLFILAGSSTPKRKGILHSGAGRIGTVMMRPMSLFESGHSSGRVSLEELCNDSLKPEMGEDVKLESIISYIVSGGWPGNLSLECERARIMNEEYLKAVINNDVLTLDGKERNLHKMRLLLFSLARSECTTISYKSLSKDIKEKDEVSLDEETIKEYLDVFDRLFLLDNLKPFGLHMRSALRTKKSEKRRFIDPSIASSLLGANEESLMYDLRTLGFLFESLVIRDMKVYAESFNGEVYHYQDYDEDEIDLVIELKNGDWSAFEVKLGCNMIDDAALKLLKIKDKIKKKGEKEPKVLCVISGLSNACYKRQDGVYVVPITFLKN